jgi:asparagine synthase (glutamine-hydrolysing)
MYIEQLNGKVKVMHEQHEYYYRTDKWTFLFDVNYDKVKEFPPLIPPPPPQHNQTTHNSSNGDDNFFGMFYNNPTIEQLDKIIVGGFFIVLINNSDCHITVFRDTSGIKTGYYFNENNRLIIGTNVHKIAKSAKVTSFNKIITDMLLIRGFTPDGETIYSCISEVKMGGKIEFNEHGNIYTMGQELLKLSCEEIDLPKNIIISKTREIISNTHRKHASKTNIVYLSGGIDSCVMLAALEDSVGRSNLHSISYKVKGTNQDETFYAKSIADYLGISNDIIEIDPKDKIAIESFKERILKMNNPYYGLFIFSPYNPDLSSTFFAGQDTRLLSPAVNLFDQIVFNRILSETKKTSHDKNLKKTLRKLYQVYNRWYNSNKLFISKNKIIKNFDRIGSILDIDDYINKYIFGLYPERDIVNCAPMTNYASIKKYYNIDFFGVLSKREIYNRIVAIKWGEQYTDDIRYMQDMAKCNNTYIQMPFYDIEFARFASSVPFDFATKFVLGKNSYGKSVSYVNKILLREAYKDKLNDDVFSRRKAVSLTLHLIINGAMRNIIRDILNNDIMREKDSFIKKYGYENIYERFINTTEFMQSEYVFMLKVYYLACLCIYYENLLL